MASIFTPSHSEADENAPIHEIDEHSTNPHEGLASLGSLESEHYEVVIYSTELGPRYSVYDRNDGTELSVLITAERLSEWYPELKLDDIDFTSSGALMIAENEELF